MKAAIMKVPERLKWDEAAEAQAVKAGDDAGTPRVTAH